MKILHVLKHTYRGAGNVCAVVDLACEQAKAGHTVAVLSGGGHFDDVLAAYRIPHITLPLPLAKASALRSLWRLHQAIRTFDPDIVHAHMMGSAVLSALLRVLGRFKLVTTVHNEFQPSAILMGVGDRVIGVSQAVSESMMRRGVPKSRMRTVLNGSVGSARFPAAFPPPAALARPAVLTVCGQHPRKGVDDLVTAFATLAPDFPSARLYIAGSGPCQGEYEALADRLCPGRFTFVGHLDDPRPYMAGADVFVLASHAEPAGLVIAEARWSGCAIVATNVGGIPEMVDHGEAGTLVPPSQPDALAAAISNLLGDADRLAEMRARARLNVDRFSVARVARDTYAVYLEALGSTQGVAEHRRRGPRDIGRHDKVSRPLTYVEMPSRNQHGESMD